MSNDRFRALLATYADRQTGPIRRFLLTRHIVRCSACLAELEAIQTMRSALRANLQTHRAPPALAMRIASALPRDTPPSVRPKPFRLGFAGAAMAGGCVGVALTLMVARMTPSPDPLITDVVADHVRSMMADHLTDVATSNQHTVKPWLSARLALSPVVEDFVAEGFPLVGGRLDYVDGHRAAAIVYRHGQHVINLFAYVGRERSDAAPALKNLDGFNVVQWRMGGLSYIAVSDLEAAQLLTFVRLVESG